MRVAEKRDKDRGKQIWEECLSGRMFTINSISIYHSSESLIAVILSFCVILSLTETPILSLHSRKIIFCTKPLVTLVSFLALILSIHWIIWEWLLWMIYRLTHDFCTCSIFTYFLKTMPNIFDIMGCCMGRVWHLNFFSLILDLNLSSF